MVAGCAVREYGDGSCIMGNGQAMTRFNAVQRYRNDWMHPSSVVQDVTRCVRVQRGRHRGVCYWGAGPCEVSWALPRLLLGCRYAPPPPLHPPSPPNTLIRARTYIRATWPRASACRARPSAVFDCTHALSPPSLAHCNPYSHNPPLPAPLPSPPSPHTYTYLPGQCRAQHHHILHRQ